jgi:hypothetical protein
LIEYFDDGNHRSPAQYQGIKYCLLRQRGNVSLTNLQVLNAILYVAEHGCKWSGLPKRFGRWHTIYTRATTSGSFPVLRNCKLTSLPLLAIRPPGDSPCSCHVVNLKVITDKKAIIVGDRFLGYFKRATAPKAA